MKAIINVIEGDKITFKQQSQCYRCKKTIKEGNDRYSIGCISGRMAPSFEDVVFEWQDYCVECGKEIKEASRPLENYFKPE